MTTATHPEDMLDEANQSFELNELKAAYYGSDPAAFVAACVQRPRDDERLQSWAEWCEQDYIKKKGHGRRHDDLFAFWVVDAKNQFSGSPDGLVVKADEATAVLRSIFAPPWLCGEVCKRCEGTGEAYGTDRTYNPPNKCPLCKGFGRTPPEFDPRWRTVSVLDEARGIRGGVAMLNGLGCKITGTEAPPDFSRMPILADALMDAGCDSGAILVHLHSGGPWVKEDWVLNLILGEIK